jgi:hypothetical protein
MATKAETPMPPANADLQTTWAYLEEGVDHIMTRLRDGISYSKYMNLYTVAYNYCVSSRMHGNLDSSVGLGGRSEFLASCNWAAPFRERGGGTMTDLPSSHSGCQFDGFRSI